jgi:hypothetical protein
MPYGAPVAGAYAPSVPQALPDQAASGGYAPSAYDGSAYNSSAYNGGWTDTMSRPEPMRQEGPAGVLDRSRPEAAWAPPADWAPPQDEQVWDGASAELATWIIDEANQQAAEIRGQARERMSASIAGAEQEAAELLRKASEQATAALTTAEQEAAEIRAAVTKLSEELGGVATRLAENFVGFAPPGTKPATRPAAKPAAQPEAAPDAEPKARPARPADRTATKPKPGAVGQPETGLAAEPATGTVTAPATRPARGPAAKPGTEPGRSKPKGAPRQLVAARVAAVTTAALLVFGAAAGVTEIGMHGFAFFVFRSAGAGSTNKNGLQEDQGPGQPDAPKATPTQVKSQSGARAAIVVHSS